MTELPTARLAAFLEREGPELGLGPGPFELTYVPNPGGFMNASFTVRSPAGAWHCKIAHPETVADLRRWWDVRDLLEARYHAPAALAWVRLGESGPEGVLSEHVEAPRADYGERPALWPVVQARVEAMADDRELAAALAPAGTIRGPGSGEAAPGRGPEARPPSCAEYLERAWLAMLRTDVAETRASESAPPFVDEPFWDWALDEVARIADLARAADAFTAPADRLIHGDLWAGNVLASDAGWWIVDWDDLGPGDPAKDLTDWWLGTGRTPPVHRPDVRARLPLWERTRLLVDAVDPLADWAEAVVAPPAVREPMRDAFRAIHASALQRYRATYG